MVQIADTVPSKGCLQMTPNNYWNLKSACMVLQEDKLLHCTCLVDNVMQPDMSQMQLTLTFSA